MTDDNKDSESDTESKDTITSIGRKAQLAETPDSDPRGGSNGGSGSDESTGSGSDE